MLKRAVIMLNFAFVYFEDDRDAEDAIRGLNNAPFGYDRHRLTLEWAKFETQEDATEALKCTHMSKISDRVVSVEYALMDDDEKGDRYDSPRRDYGRHGDSPYRRSPGPTYRRGGASRYLRSPVRRPRT
ncbi:hypothetical protein ACH5RR_000042 [Cinchona calisaya]|uniref:RRM domain-containing protein n=1 Tax=Cinchona calisaya TaxID=153742 RepID=A0ABD3B003_9GENT